MGDEVKECLNALRVDQLKAPCSNEIHHSGDELKKKVVKMILIDLESYSKDCLTFLVFKKKNFTKLLELIVPEIQRRRVCSSTLSH